MKKISELLYKLKAWVEGFAAKPYATWALFIIAFVESSFFPIPPDVLLIALGVAQPKRAFWYALICTLGSVSGAFLGYYIGYAFFETIGSRIVDFYGFHDKFQSVLGYYRDNAWTAIIFAGFTPIPYKVFTIAAGFNQTIDLVTLALASLVGRASRFLAVGCALYFFGPKMKEYLDKYLERLTLALGILFILGILTVKYIL
ncbi:MAG: DedA family protein [Bacteroidetes bacterium]|nr:DedA family protein [Bacteroidota bacterium]MCW5895397.1 DedA family protein [Bacteroidota bacterium]